MGGGGGQDRFHSKKKFYIKPCRLHGNLAELTTNAEKKKKKIQM